MNKLDQIKIITSFLNEKFNRKFGSSDESRLFLNSILKTISGKIITQDSNCELKRFDNYFEIYIKPYHSPLRDNWTIAHALGYYFLNPLKESFDWYQENISNIEANRFAAELLLPEKQLKDFIVKYPHDIEHYITAGYFGVPVGPVKKRLEYIL